VSEPLAVLVLPRKLERFELAAHARDLLAIPRVIALEPPRLGASGLLGEAITARNARRLRFPGEPRVLVLYDPRQYPLARALLATYEQSELWYVRADRDALQAEPPRRRDQLLSLDDRASERAVQLLVATADADPRVQNEPLRLRLFELEVISARPFVPGARVDYR
jgi:hypothetical protein